ncbi:MAG: DUF4389 domain-containing protein [Pseudohongiellaceae bacterium]
MNEQSEQIKKNFLGQWIRLAFVVLYIIVFGLLWPFIALLLLGVIILQSLYRVMSAKNNSTLSNFSEGLVDFLLKVMQYVLYISDEKPIDFDALDFRQKNDKTDIDVHQTTEDSVFKSGEPIEEKDLKSEEESGATEAAKPSSGSEGDVFSDISFTEQTKNSASNVDADEPLKDPD